MKPIDKLAREICWLGFSVEYRKTSGYTKARYWKRLTEAARASYRKEAMHFVWMYDNIDPYLLHPLSFRIDDDE